MADNNKLGYGIAIGIAIVVIIAFIPFSAKSEDIYFINSGGSGGVISLQSSNDAIILNATSGNILITPKKELLCHVVLASPNATIGCNFTAKKYLEVELLWRSDNSGSNFLPAFILNADAGNNYAYRFSRNGATDSTITSTSLCSIGLTNLASNGNGGIIYSWINNNVAGDRKLIYTVYNDGINTDATTLPNRIEHACKWSNTTSQITSIKFASNTSMSGLYNTNTVLTVWGYD